MKRRKGFYSISVVAKMFSVHQQTIRMYEKEGLIAPKRTEGNTRLFSEEDVDRLEEVINLTHKMGINLAGVQMILKLQKKIKKMQFDMNKLFDQAHGSLEEEGADYKQDMHKLGEKLLDLKQEGAQKRAKEQVSVEVQSSADEGNKKGSGQRRNEKNSEQEMVDDWEIEYDKD